MADEPLGNNLVLEDEGDDAPGALVADEGQADVKKARKPRAATVTGPKKVRIRLEDSPEIPPTGLFLGHNGIGYVIEAGKEVDVPEFLLEILDNAVMSVPVMDPNTQQVVDYRNRLRYPYQVIRT